MTAAAALAWACTPSAFTSLTPSSGGPGAMTTVRGEGFVEGPIEIRWASTGAVLTTATGPTFSVAVTIPADAPAGAHYIQSVARNPADGAVAGEHIRAFEVTDPSATTPRPEPKSQPRSENRAQASPPKQRAKPAPQPPVEPAPTPVEPQPQVESPAVASPPAASVAEPTAPPQQEQPAEQRTQRADDSAQRSPKAPPTPSEGSAVGDLWNGVAPGERSSAAAGLAETTPDSGGAGPQLVLGIVLLSLGLVTLLGGAAALTVRKRRRATGSGLDRVS